MTKLVHPFLWIVGLLIALLVSVGLILRKHLGRSGIYASLFAAGIVLGAWASPDVVQYTWRFAALLLFPALCLWWYWKDRGGGRTGTLRRLALAAAGAAVILDLTEMAHDVEFVYSGQPHPGPVLGIDTRLARAPVLVNERLTAPLARKSTTGHVIRYPSLMERKAFVFSPTDFEKQSPYIEFHQYPLTGTSLDDWPVSAARKLPLGFEYEQSGTGGRVERVPDTAPGGGAAILIHRSSTGLSFLRWRPVPVERVRGSAVKFSIWVNSTDYTSGTIAVDVQDGIVEPRVAVYNNSGTWERLEVLAYVPKTAKYFMVTLSVSAATRADALFGGAQLELAHPVEPGRMGTAQEFAEALASKRATSLLLLREYVELIRSDIPASAKKVMFAVKQPLFQAKHAAFLASDDDTEAGLKMAGESRAQELLRDGVFLNDVGDSGRLESLGISLARRAVSPETEASAVAAGQEPAIGIKSYAYDEVGLRVSSARSWLLYWADGFDPGWKAWIDDRPVPIYRANIDFKAVAVPAGAHSISFTYENSKFAIAVAMFYLVMLLALVASAVLFVAEARRTADRGIL